MFFPQQVVHLGGGRRRSDGRAGVDSCAGRDCWPYRERLALGLAGRGPDGRASSRGFRALGRSDRRWRAAFLGAGARPRRQSRCSGSATRPVSWRSVSISGIRFGPAREPGGRLWRLQRARTVRSWRWRARARRWSSHLDRRHHVVRAACFRRCRSVGLAKGFARKMDGVSRRAGGGGRQPRSVAFPRRQALRPRAGHSGRDRRRVRGSRFEGPFRSLGIVR